MAIRGLVAGRLIVAEWKEGDGLRTRRLAAGRLAEVYWDDLYALVAGRVATVSGEERLTWDGARREAATRHHGGDAGGYPKQNTQYRSERSKVSCSAPPIATPLLWHGDNKHTQKKYTSKMQ